MLITDTLWVDPSEIVSIEFSDDGCGNAYVFVRLNHGDNSIEAFYGPEAKARDVFNKIIGAIQLHQLNQANATGNLRNP